jgi:hypothetical protein
MRENLAFTDRVIRRLQDNPSRTGPFVAACTGYLLRHDRLAFDHDRDLMWVVPPAGPAQVAVWLV